MLVCQQSETPVFAGVFCCKDVNNKQKYPSEPDKRSDYFANVNWANRLSVVPSILR